jgi:hypothetical protein
MKLLASLALFLEREAGYHVVSLALIAAGIILVDPSQRPQIAHDLVIFGTGVLARSMSGKKDTPETAGQHS